MDSAIRLWGFPDGDYKGILIEEIVAVKALDISPDGVLLASGGGDSKIKLWDAQEMLELREIWGHRQRVRSVHFSPDGQTLVSSGDDGTLRVWRVSDGQLIRLYDLDQGEILSAQYSPDGKLIAMGSSNGFVGLISNPFSTNESVTSAQSQKITETKESETEAGKGNGKDPSKAGKSDGSTSDNDSEIQEKLRDWAKKSPVPIPDFMINYYLFIVIGFGFLVFLVLLLILRRLKR